MFKRNISKAAKRERKGLVSYILLQEGDVPDTKLAVTRVEVAPGSHQTPHHHAPEQVYLILKGKGIMRVGEEEDEVAEGDLIYIPSNVVHGIANLSQQVLAYLSASTPSFDIKSYYDTGKV